MYFKRPVFLTWWTYNHRTPPYVTILHPAKALDLPLLACQLVVKRPPTMYPWSSRFRNHLTYFLSQLNILQNSEINDLTLYHRITALLSWISCVCVVGLRTVRIAKKPLHPLVVSWPSRIWVREGNAITCHPTTPSSPPTVTALTDQLTASQSQKICWPTNHPTKPTNGRTVCVHITSGQFRFGTWTELAQTIRTDS